MTCEPTATSELIAFQSSHRVELIAPIDVASDPDLPISAGATSEFRVYDPTEETTLSALEAIGQTELSVSSVAPFVVGDIVELTQDDATIHASTVASIDSVAGTVTIADPTTVAAAAGNRFRVRLGPVVAMALFGTPSATARDWGFEGTLASDHPGLTAGRCIQIEIIFVGSPGGDLDLLKIICATISSATCC